MPAEPEAERPVAPAAEPAKPEPAEATVPEPAQSDPAVVVRHAGIDAAEAGALQPAGAADPVRVSGVRAEPVGSGPRPVAVARHAPAGIHIRRSDAHRH